MRVVALREKTISIASPMKNAVIDFSQMTVSLVAVVTDAYRGGRRLIGFGFNSNGRYGQGGLLREQFFPRLLSAAPESLVDSDDQLDPLRVRRALLQNEKPGGHGERSVAVGIIDMAVWDVLAKAFEVPLAVLLAQRHGGTPSDRVSVYAAGGYYYPDEGIETLKTEMRGYLDRGYTSVKMKIGGASLDDDLRRIDAVLSVVGDPGRLAVDANARFDIDQALEYSSALQPLGLRWFEEPVDPLDFASLAVVADAYSRPLATGENLFSTIDATNLARFGGLREDRDYLQMDPVLSYGLSEYIDMLDGLAQLGWGPLRHIPHGGNQMNLAAAAAFGLGGVESYPDLFEPFGGFADDEVVVDGSVGWPTVPGIGLEEKSGLRGLLDDLVSDVQ